MAMEYGPTISRAKLLLVIAVALPAFAAIYYAIVDLELFSG